MYRQYENPYTLEKQLEELKEKYCEAVEENANDDILTSLMFNIMDLEERVNFAWQDQYEE